MELRSFFFIFTILILNIFDAPLNSSMAANSNMPTRAYKGSARFTVKAERVDEFKGAVLKIIAPTRKEKGCISYEAFQVVKDGHLTNSFEFHELWASEKAMMIDHKEKSAHMIEFFKTVAIGKPESLVESFEVSGHEVVILGPSLFESSR